MFNLDFLENKYKVYDKDGFFNSKIELGKINRKPITKLSIEDIVFIYMNDHFEYYTGLDDFYSLMIKSYKNNSEMYQECFNFIKNLKFPCKAYRALRKGEDLSNICGKNFSLSWTIDPNLYFDERSPFKNCETIVEAIIPESAVHNEWTVKNFIYYSSPSRKRQIDTYPENEITLKPRFKNSILNGLKLIDKNNMIPLLKEMKKIKPINESYLRKKIRKITEDCIKKLVKEGVLNNTEIESDEDETELSSFEEYKMDYPNDNFDVSDMTSEELARWCDNIGDFLFVYRGLRGLKVMVANSSEIVDSIIDDLNKCRSIEPSHEVDYLFEQRKNEFVNDYVCIFKIKGSPHGDYYVVYQDDKTNW